MKHSKRLQSHWTAISAAASALAHFATTSSADGAYIFSGQANIPIPANIDGVYLNVVTWWTGTSGAATPGWDINPFLFSGQGAIFTDTGGGLVSTSASGGVYNVPQASVVGPASIYDTGIATGTPDSLLNPLTVGFRFINEVAGNQVQYGWMTLRLPQVDAPGVVYDWCYEDSGLPIVVGFVPSPGVCSLLAMGAAGLALRRSSKR